MDGYQSRGKRPTGSSDDTLTERPEFGDPQTEVYARLGAFDAI
jgi:hypothetical protein